MKRWGLLVAAIVGLWSGVAAAQGSSGGVRNVPIDAFFGTFNGTGFAEGQDKDYFGTTLRDLDVKISSAPNGFVATWTTVVRGGGDPKQPRERKRSATIAFKTGAKPGQFVGTESGDLFSGKPAVWARIAGQTLYIYELNILEDGRYDMQTHARTLTGGGMELLYTRVTDGEAMRNVKGRLVKIAR